ncbi:hypothetical protein HYT59_02440 [Candidatus Woesebacteria bacterium]|nr:hypothetical protein [Candidatus Woesebacteria bacterium]
MRNFWALGIVIILVLLVSVFVFLNSKISSINQSEQVEGERPFNPGGEIVIPEDFNLNEALSPLNPGISSVYKLNTNSNGVDVVGKLTQVLTKENNFFLSVSVPVSGRNITLSIDLGDENNVISEWSIESSKNPDGKINVTKNYKALSAKEVYEKYKALIDLTVSVTVTTGSTVTNPLLQKYQANNKLLETPTDIKGDNLDIGAVYEISDETQKL